MKYRVDTKSGNKLSVLGFGCMRFSGNSTVKSIASRSVKEEKIEKLLLKAVRGGINYFDTAYIYPGSEEMLGKTFAKHGLRDKVFIATKLPLVLLRKKEDIEKYFQTELKRLQTDYIDYYLMHMLPDMKEWNRLCGWGIREWIKEKKDRGIIKQIGFSYHGSREEFLRLLDAYDWDFVQIQYNYSDENYQAGVTGLKAASAKGIPVMIMEPMLGGRLATGLPQKAVERFRQTNPESSPVSWAFRWLWNQPEVTLLLSGMNEMKQLKENLALANQAKAGCLTSEEINAFMDVRSILRESYKVPCTGCHYCMPCPHGVDIPTCFSAYNARYAIGKGTGTQQYLMSTILTSGSGYASLCVKCGKCEKHCPQHIPIRQKLQEVEKTMEGVGFKVMRTGKNIYSRFRKR